MIDSTPQPRYRLIDRDLYSEVSLDEQLPADHPARAVWAFVGSVDLSAFEGSVKSVQGHAGAPAHSPRLLFALWLFACIDGVCLARELARRCRRDLPYQWLCGGSPPNYHTLSDFQSGNAELIHEVFVDHVAALLDEGLIQLHRATLDGTKRAGNAGGSHFHREATLLKHRQVAEEHLQRWRQGQVDASKLSARQQAAQRRAARERVDRLNRAIEKVREVQRQRQGSRRKGAKPEQARASEADPDATRQKEGDGGFRVGYNVQTMTDSGSGLIICTEVISQGNDAGQLGSMLAKVQAEQAGKPREVLVDKGYASHDDLAKAEQEGVEVYMPPKSAGTGPSRGEGLVKRKRRDNPSVAAWRARMATAEAKAIYKQRPPGEIIHARMTQRKWHRFRLRGLPKVNAEALWQALAHNVKRLMEMGKMVLAGGVRVKFGY
jgi:transposase